MNINSKWMLIKAAGGPDAGEVSQTGGGKIDYK